MSAKRKARGTLPLLAWLRGFAEAIPIGKTVAKTIYYMVIALVAIGSGIVAFKEILKSQASEAKQTKTVASAGNSSQIVKSADLYNEAVKLMLAGKHREAAEAFDEFLKKFPDSPARDRAKAEYNLAVCYQNLAAKESGTLALEKARDGFQSFLRKYPQDDNVAKASGNLTKVNVLIIERKR